MILLLILHLLIKTLNLIKTKFGDNPSKGVLSKNNCYDPRSPNDKYLDNDSMNTLKKDLQKFLIPVDCFCLMTFTPNVQKIIKKKKLNVKLLNLIMYIKQMTTLTLKLKLSIIFLRLLMKFMFHKIILKIWLTNTLSICH